MIEAFQEQRTLVGERVRLVPLGPEHFAGEWAMLQDEESRRLTGTHQTFTEKQIREWLTKVRRATDRADWAILHDGAFVGEVVLNDLDEDNRSAGFRIVLAAHAIGRGYGTEATLLAVRYAFEDAGLHRVWLEVFEHNPRARHVYEKCGFRLEGEHRDALLWDGEWHNTHTMAILSTDRMS
ncbi:GNAT family N-acetyltransferase [Actinophytocola glycyrrhizae]|uniref:GNAT family N-acetyltransferase n=1 Tax=Actinophytocola glycyrrhizae TaxID=2044873 RepID=A0ABV9S4Y3_9PSEU